MVLSVRIRELRGVSRGILKKKGMLQAQKKSLGSRPRGRTTTRPGGRMKVYNLGT